MKIVKQNKKRGNIMKKVKKVTCLIMALVTMLSLASCGGNEELQTQINDLQKRIEKLEEEKNDLQTKNQEQEIKLNDLQAGNQEQDIRLDDLEQEKNILEERLETIELQNMLERGVYYSLTDAYEYGFLTRENIMSIAYYDSGKVSEQKEDKIVDLDFIPEMSIPELDEEIEYSLKVAYYKNNRDEFISEGYSSEASAVKQIKITQFFGCYNGSYVVKMEIGFIGGGTGIGFYTVGDIVFWTSERAFIKVLHI